MLYVDCGLKRKEMRNKMHLYCCIRVNSYRRTCEGNKFRQVLCRYFLVSSPPGVSSLLKRKKMAKSSNSGEHQQMRLDLLPSALLATVMTKLDVAFIRSLACTCKAFHSCASHMFCFIPTFHLLDIAPSADLLRPLIPPNPYIHSLKVHYMRLDDSSLDYLLPPTLEELCIHN